MPKRKPKDLERSADLPHNWIARHLARIEAFVEYDAIDLTPWQVRRARLTAPGRYEYLDAGWKDINLGEMWGGPDVTAFFRKTVTIPAGHAGPNTYLDINMDGGETQLSINGRPWQGLDWYRSLIPLGDFAQAGRELTLEMEAFIINYPYDERRHDERDMHRFDRARLLKRDPLLEAFLIDARLALDAYLSLYRTDDDLELEGFLRHHLEAVCRAIGPRIQSRDEARAAVERAHPVLRQTIFQNTAFRRPGRINICAHSHLDIVYLWPIKETLRKNCRTITNQLSLMREFPEYRFSYSQPFLYETLKEMYPAVFEEVRRRVAEGRWEVVGAMYIEPDGNLPGAESLVRQLLFGKRFIREEFGLEAATCWLPDVFGVMYTLPQILRKTGVNYFLTAKLNIWNDTNDFPFDTFRWRGPDGSEVIAHFPPTHFAQKLEYDTLRRHWRDFRNKPTAAENLYIYGYGDGGGGPTREMAAASLRVADFPGLPETRIRFAEEFFRRAAQRAGQLPVWDDELYLEAHRGVHTTKGALKRQNRQAELLYRDAEILSSMAWLAGGPRVQERLNQGWKLLLLNQFHDTLPGTHKPAATPDIQADYETVFAIGRDVRDRAVAHLAGQLDPHSGDVAVFNTLGWPRAGLVQTDHRPQTASVRLSGGDPLPVQHFDGKTWFRVPQLPSLGWTTAAFADDAPSTAGPTAVVSGPTIDTPLYRIELDDAGNLARLHDKRTGHEVLDGPGNQFQLFEDDPGVKFSAWDVAYHLEEYRHPVQQVEPWRLAANGPLFAVFTARWQALDSTIEQVMWLYAADPRIDFVTRAEWRNSRKMLKVAFPLRVRTRRATFDLPFGHIERATHRNTGWEQAKFEVNGHKWADMSEGDYGVALLNNCKYGYDARENVLRLSLVRSPVRPDAHSDIGPHEFSYALLPHAGGWRQAQVDRRAYEFNIPPLAADIPAGATAALPDTRATLRVDSASVIAETLKQAESGEGLILRTFDSHGCHADVAITPADRLIAAAETNLLEEQPHPLPVNAENGFTVACTPYEIKTHRLIFARIGKNNDPR